MKVVTNKKKKVVTVRVSDLMAQELHYATEHYLQFTAKVDIVGVRGFSLEDDDMVLRFIIDPKEEDAGVRRSSLLWRKDLEVEK